MGVRGYTLEGLPCGETHPRAHVPDCIVLEIRDRVENRREAIKAVLADLRARDYVVSRAQAYRIVNYETRAAVAVEFRRE